MNDAFDDDDRGGGDGDGPAVDTGTIAWLLPEIVAALDAATAALRDFRAGAAGVDRTDVDLGSLRVARAHLHQAHGALELSELAGVGKLTEAMETLLGTFEDDPSRCTALVLGTIVGGCCSIVEYLEDLLAGVPPQPLLLYPSYRDLLVARKADRVHPADLFAVDLGVRPPRDEDGRALDDAGLAEQRRGFEQGLLRYIRNESDVSALVALERAVTAIDGSVAKTAKSGQNQQRAFWWAARALFEALAHDGFAHRPAQRVAHQADLKRLAGRINLQIRKLVEGSGAVAERLFTDTLFFVAIAAPVTQHVRDVQAAYRLRESVPQDFETQRYGRIDATALKSAREALAAAKIAWSGVVAGDAAQIPVFAKEAAALLDAVRVIKRRGLAQVAGVVDGIATDLGFDPRRPSVPVGLDVATALLFMEGALDRARTLDEAFDRRAALVVARVEASALGREAAAAPLDWLDRISRKAEERLTTATFVAELQANLRNAEKVLDAFFREPSQRADLPHAQTALAQVSGALALLGHDDVHRAIDHARETIGHFRQAEVAADPATFAKLAESLGAVGFYVDQIQRDRVDGRMFHFDPATGAFSAALAPIGAPAPDDASPVVVDAGPEIVGAAPVEVAGETDRAFMATEILDAEGSLEDEIVRRAADASAAADRLSRDAGDATVEQELVAALDDVRRNARLIDDLPLQVEAESLLSAARASNADRPADLATGVVRLVSLARRSAGIAPSLTPQTPVTSVPPAADAAAVDAELLDIFLEEATAVLADAEASMHALDADPADDQASSDLRRGFHTLKGSSRMVGLSAFGDAAWSIEETLNDHLANQTAASDALRGLIGFAIAHLADWVAELQADGVSTRVPDALVEAARMVRAGETPGGTPAPAPLDEDAKTTSTSRDVPAEADAYTASVINGRTAIDSIWADEVPIDGIGTGAAIDDSPIIDDPWAEEHDAPGADDAFGMSDPAGADRTAPADEVPAPTSNDAGPDAPDNVVPFVLPATQPDARPRAEEVRRIGPLTLSLALFNIYLTEADELLRVLTQDFGEWRHELDRFVSESAMRAAHSLAGSSATVGLVPAHDLASGIEDVLMALWRDPVALNDEQVMRLQDAVESLRRMLHRFAAERMPDPDPVRIAGLLALRKDIAVAVDGTTNSPSPAPDAATASVWPFEPLDFGEAPASGKTVDTDAADPVAADADPRPPIDDDPFPGFVFDDDDSDSAPVVTPAEADPAQDSVFVSEPHEEEPEAGLTTVDADTIAVARRAAALQRESVVRDDLDSDLVDVFVAEASEILPQVGALLRTWQAGPGDPTPARGLLRLLHTLKGSARMAGAMRLGEVVHEIETRVEAAARLPSVPGPLIDELLAEHDRSLELFDQVQHPDLQSPVAEASSVPESMGEPSPDGAVAGRSASRAATTERRDPARARDARQGAQQVRVASDTLDRLVNLAGEVSISRARIENEVQQIKGAMGDLSENVERLRGQLREIELQAEFQLQSRKQSQQASGAEREKFDPLEFDRFTRFQELTRMMAESVNDVKTVQQHLARSLDSAETDLATQRRMTRDLQQDLMKVRMVPFASIAERLYRVARQSAKELDKRVNLDIRGNTVEIDRGVLERMTGPFEHLLRNHIVHGIETRDVRRARGKDEIGELLIEVRQEGNEIVLTFSDDGAGLDHDRIRAKGRELGLIGAPISDAQAAELIFHPGFSTALEITELAGRGVGMDVVRAEAQQLGGRVTVDSTRGVGSRFTIRLPLTLAITQVVLVAVADRVYALPAMLVEHVMQTQSQPLADAYRAGHVEWAGAPVRLAFLGDLLGLDDAVPVAQRVSPVVILRSAGERIAVHVDEVVANQEVVVKNLGPQLARMIGIVGATVLGSGDIVLILNPVQLAQVARAEATPAVAREAAAGAPAREPDAGLQTLPTVMVVDDSLTVRRVTQRLLSREGYQVVLAKDGVDALEQLVDFPPDVMLVDIEMPRMDGFDLTRNLRADERYRHIPIIMITSRTAEKHRRHAAELGVDAYLGKPYQEDELLELIALHATRRRGHVA